MLNTENAVKESDSNNLEQNNIRQKSKLKNSKGQNIINYDKNRGNDSIGS